MKARVKATGEIVEINETHTEIFTDVHDNAFSIDEIDFNVVERKDPDYWTRLEHQYAGMAMQILIKEYREAQGKYGLNDKLVHETCAKESIEFATALVEKLKEKEERK